MPASRDKKLTALEDEEAQEVQHHHHEQRKAETEGLQEVLQHRGHGDDAAHVQELPAEVQDGSESQIAHEGLGPADGEAAQGAHPTTAMTAATSLSPAHVCLAVAPWMQASTTTTTTRKAKINNQTSELSQAVQGPSFVLWVLASHSPHAMLEFFLFLAQVPGAPPGERASSFPWNQRYRDWQSINT